jgi:uncharacterized protein YyaL (SSP411 family)
MHPYTNRLAKETSPYLLQHAHNPVDWYPWGEEAFEKARTEDKPVLVSIGYAACHWCHVMERESFEDPEVAALMNEHFVNIKVDREERPDVDHVYMDAVQALEGQGGWPLNVFLTSDRKPFFGGTYFPPKRAFNRASWTEVLMAVADSYKNKKEDILNQAEGLTQHLKASNSFGLSANPLALSATSMDTAFQNIMKQADREWGGFGRAPKFPQTFSINFLLAYAHLQKNEEAKQQALLSLDKMLQGGIYDQVGGGFARYSTDTEWLVPHFEKMLNDNALLVCSIADAYELTGDERYKQTIQETLAFIERELMHPEGGFYSALDADSEGEEGKFYVWSLEEVKAVLGEDADQFCRYFDITEKGNWEGKNILWLKQPLVAFAKANNIDTEQLSSVIERGKKALLAKRSERVRPQLDDKVLLSWNALMNLAYSRAYAALGNEHYKQVAISNMHFMLSSYGDARQMKHSWKNSTSKHPAFLEDYAYLVAALLELGQVSSDFSYLDKAQELTQVVLDLFSDEDQTFFYFTAEGQADVLVRKKEIYDGATPSGNAVMAYNLYRLGILFDRQEYRARAEKMLAAMGEVPVKYPTSFGLWLFLGYEMLSGTAEIAVIGRQAEKYIKEMLFLYLPHRLIMASDTSLQRYPILAGKPDNSENHIYLCQNYSCRKPVNTVGDFVKLLNLK